jgi:uncharacterized protein YfbU (UPF0304 family)
MPVVTIRMEEDIKRRIDVVCEKAGTSISDFVREAIDSYISDYAYVQGSPNRSLSYGERAILLAIRKLENSLSPSQELQNEIEILENGWEGEYEGLLPPNETVAPSVTKEVRSILTMYLELKIGFGKSNRKLSLSVDDVTFPGFDHEGEESKHLEFAKFLVLARHRFGGLRSEAGEINLRSDHESKIDQYRVMLPVWEKVREANAKSGRYELTIEQVHQIVMAPKWKREVR